MQRIACPERADWRGLAEEVGFNFHTIDGERYWDESAYYGFTLEQIERDIEAPTAELDGMCRELIARAVADDRMLRVLRIPDPVEQRHPFIAVGDVPAPPEPAAGLFRR